MKHSFFRFSAVVAGVLFAFAFLALPAADAQLSKIFRRDFQLENLVVTEVSSVNEHEGIIKAVRKRDATFCFEFSGGKKHSIPCAEAAVSDANVYIITVSGGTELFFKNRTAATLADFSAGDKINVFGNTQEDTGTSTIDAIIVRNMSDKGEGKKVLVYHQLNNLLLVSMTEEAGGSRIITAQSRGGDTYTITVKNVTIFLTKNRQPVTISAFTVGTVFNVWGLFNTADKTMNALIIRTLSDETTGATIQGVIQSIDGANIVLKVEKATGFPHLAGRMITIQSGLTASTSIQVHGMLDPAGNIMNGVRRIIFKPFADGN